MQRRHFLQALGLPLLPSMGALLPVGGLERIGLQLYTVRELMRQDLARTLERVAKIGYREVEFAGYFGETPARIRGLLDSVGLDAPSTHLSLRDLGPDLARSLDLAERIGHRYLVVPSLDPQDRRTLDDYRRVAAALDRAGEGAQARGLRVAYHNHDFELDPIGGVRPYDLLLRETDPALVHFEIDVYWMARGRADPVAYFERFPGRFHLCHLKDMDRAGDMADVGAGRLDFRAILRRREQAGLRHWYVEHDHPRSPLESVRASHRWLRDLRFVPPRSPG
jgi:sugar phosphate isomerase/epimerase